VTAYILFFIYIRQLNVLLVITLTQSAMNISCRFYYPFNSFVNFYDHKPETFSVNLLSYDVVGKYWPWFVQRSERFHSLLASSLACRISGDGAHSLAQCISSVRSSTTALLLLHRLVNVGHLPPRYLPPPKKTTTAVADSCYPDLTLTLT